MLMYRNFSSQYGAVFWIAAEHRVNNIEMLLLLLSRVYTEPRLSLLFICHTGEEVGGEWEIRRKHSRNR